MLQLQKIILYKTAGEASDIWRPNILGVGNAFVCAILTRLTTLDIIFAHYPPGYAEKMNAFAGNLPTDRPA